MPATLRHTDAEIEANCETSFSVQVTLPCYFAMDDTHPPPSPTISHPSPAGKSGNVGWTPPPPPRIGEKCVELLGGQEVKRTSQEREGCLMRGWRAVGIAHRSHSTAPLPPLLLLHSRLIKAMSRKDRNRSTVSQNLNVFQSFLPSPRQLCMNCKRYSEPFLRTFIIGALVVTDCSECTIPRGSL